MVRSGLLSPELATAIRRLKEAKKLGVRLGNWPLGRDGFADLAPGLKRAYKRGR